MKSIYFDYAATTPVDRRVVVAMKPYLSNVYGNPGSLHIHGQQALAAVDTSREALSSALHADFRSIFFTGSATEANNIVLRGVLKQARKYFGTKPRIIFSAIEHESIFETAQQLEKEELAEVVVVNVDKNGVISLSDVKENITPNTALVSIVYINNEVGTCAPIESIGRFIRKLRGESGSKYPLFHTDAVQAFQLFECNVDTLCVDAMTLSAHKMYGPKGIGALYLRDASFFKPIITGGAQEFGMRSGTEAVHSIVGFAEAVKYADAIRSRERERIQTLSKNLWDTISSAITNISLHGPPIENENRSPHILNIHTPYWENRDPVIALDQMGLSVSAGPACAARSQKLSRTLSAMGHSRDTIMGSIRISIGRPTNAREIRTAVALLSSFTNRKL